MKLNLGCGKDIRPKEDGWINIDYIEYPGVDLILDFSKNKLPYEDNSIDEIYTSHVFEHIFNWEDVLFECYRILKSNGRMTISVPYGIYGFGAAYHCRYFNERTMEMFTNGCDQNTTLQNRLSFKLEKIKITHKYQWHSEKYLKLPWTPFEKVNIMYYMVKP